MELSQKAIDKLPPRHTPNRDEKYMGLACIIAGFSKDPHTQIGSIIVDSVSNEPLGFGYNGPPRYIDDNEINWNRPYKYDYIIHSEINAIKHSDKTKLKDSTIYVTAPPCPKCMLEIITYGISRVVYLDFDRNNKISSINLDSFNKTQHLANIAKIQLDKFVGNLIWLEDCILKKTHNG